MKFSWSLCGIESDKSVSFSPMAQTSDVAITAILALHTFLPASSLTMSPVASFSDYDLVSFQIDPSCKSIKFFKLMGK